MFVVIFEVHPKQGRRDDYLHEAGLLRPEIEQIDGFLSNDRYASLSRPDWVVSVSLWRDEKAVVRWRTKGRHHASQQLGRDEIFADYHLRVGEIVADNGLPAGETLPQMRLDETEAGAARLAVLTSAEFADIAGEPAMDEVASRLGLAQPGQEAGLVAFDAFRHLVRPQEFLLLTSWGEAAQGEAWLPRREAEGVRHRQVRVVRDYGMRDRREAPQYYRPVAG